MIKKNKIKAQQEIVGFVFIVIVITIIGLAFLSFSLSNSKKYEKKDLTYSHLVSAMMHYTTDCAKDYIPNYLTGQDLVKACYEHRTCLDNRDACLVLNETFSNIIKESLNIAPDSPRKGYNMLIFHSLNGESNQNITQIEQGSFNNCSVTVGTFKTIVDSSFSGNETIDVSLKICEA
jgi:hypothetical protein